MLSMWRETASEEDLKMDQTHRLTPAVPAAVNWRGCSTPAAGRDGAAGCIAAAYRIGDQRVEPAARRLWLSRPPSGTAGTAKRRSQRNAELPIRPSKGGAWWVCHRHLSWVGAGWAPPRRTCFPKRPHPGSTHRLRHPELLWWQSNIRSVSSG